MTIDLKGRKYLNINDVRSGQKVVVDAGFNCMAPWSQRVVMQDEHGFFLICRDGRHYLESDDPDEGSVIGVYPDDEQKPSRRDAWARAVVVILALVTMYFVFRMM